MVCESFKKKTISVLLPTLNGGGAERSMVQLANGLASAGLNVQLVAVLNADGPYRSEIADNVCLVNLGARRFRYLPIALYQYMKENHPNIIITALMNSWVLLVTKLTRLPMKIIISERTVFSEQYQRNADLLSRATILLSHKLYPLADRIVTVSFGVANDLLDSGLAREEQLRTIYNPVVNGQFRKMLAAKQDTMLLNTEKRNFIAAGRLHDVKDYPTLLKAFAMVRKEINSQLLILGEGASRAFLEEMVWELGIQEDVLLPGFVQNPFPYIAEADCFVLSSKFEGLSGVLIQALACGTTVVATDCPGGNAEILDHGKYGTLIPVGDVEALAEAMKSALLWPFPPDVLKRRAEMFSEERCVAEYINLFNELMSDKGL